MWGVARANLHGNDRAALAHTGPELLHVCKKNRDHVIRGDANKEDIMAITRKVMPLP